MAGEPRETGASAWVAVATYFLHAEALFARMRLESSGIECRLLDEHFCRMDPLAAPVVGGIKLCVLREDAANAKEILSSDPGHPFLLSDDEPAA